MISRFSSPHTSTPGFINGCPDVDQALHFHPWPGFCSNCPDAKFIDPVSGLGRAFRTGAAQRWFGSSSSNMPSRVSRPNSSPRCRVQGFLLVVGKGFPLAGHTQRVVKARL